MSLPETSPDRAVPSAATSGRLPTSEATKGVIAALLAYGFWGFLPLLFRQLDSVGSVMIVAERTLWSLVLLAIILMFVGGFADVRVLLADRRRALWTLLSAVLLAGNWLLYVWAVETGQVLEASFGYFINPLINVLMGMVLLGERQNRLQTVSILIAVVAIAIQAVGLGAFPFISLGLALSFGFYGYFRKTAKLGPAVGLFAETLMLAPVALIYVLYNLATVGVGAHGDPYLMTLLVLSGPATAVPLLLFAYGVRRLRLTTIGMFQYIAPTIQFMVAIFLFGEHLNALRLISFGLIWVSLLVFSYDSFRRRGQTPVLA